MTRNIGLNRKNGLSGKSGFLPGFIAEPLRNIIVWVSNMNVITSVAISTAFFATLLFSLFAGQNWRETNQQQLFTPITAKPVEYQGRIYSCDPDSRHPVCQEIARVKAQGTTIKSVDTSANKVIPHLVLD